jgi:hypothetical protein
MSPEDWIPTSSVRLEVRQLVFDNGDQIPTAS